MATVQHDVTVSEQPGNAHGFRHVVSCICGFMGRVGDKVKAEALAVKHAAFHGIEYVPKKVVEEVEKADTDAGSPAIPSPNTEPDPSQGQVPITNLNPTPSLNAPTGVIGGVGLKSKVSSS